MYSCFKNTTLVSIDVNTNTNTKNTHTKNTNLGKQLFFKRFNNPTYLHIKDW